MVVKDLVSGVLTVIWDFSFLVKCKREGWALGGDTKLCFLYRPEFELIQLTRDGLDRQSWFKFFDSPENSPYKGQVLEMKG
jgi:hypothetical protein